MSRPSVALVARGVVVALPSFLFGYCLAGLNAALALGDLDDPLACYDGSDPSCARGSLLRDMRLKTEYQELATGLTIAGAWLGCLIGSRPSDRYGRKATLLSNNILFIVGGLCCAISSAKMLFVGRLFCGVAVGIEGMVVPVLLSELAPPESRGAVTVIHQFMLTVGILAASVMGWALVEEVDHGWKYVQAFIAVPASLQLILAEYVPESPRWLAAHGRTTEAHRVLASLQSGFAGVAADEDDAERIERELGAMRAEAEKGSRRAGHVTWTEVLRYRVVVATGVVLMGLQAMVGINSVIFYSTTIFKQAGVPNGTLATVVVCFVNVLTTFAAAVVVDRVGRRVLLLGGTLVMVLSLGLLSLALLWLDASPHMQGLLSVMAALSYIVGFAIGFGAVGWVIIAEIVPQRIRSKAYGLFVSANWALNLLISLTTLTAINELGGVKSGMAQTQRDLHEKRGVARLYIIFGGICAFAIAFVYLFVPETMGRTLEDGYRSLNSSGASSGRDGESESPGQTRKRLLPRGTALRLADEVEEGIMEGGGGGVIELSNSTDDSNNGSPEAPVVDSDQMSRDG